MGITATLAAASAAELNITEPVPHNGSFRIGSVTKPFIATVVLQLVGEGAGRRSATTAPVRGTPGPALEKLQNEVFCGKQKGSWVDPAPLPAL
jgi:hypothetical protein